MGSENRKAALPGAAVPGIHASSSDPEFTDDPAAFQARATTFRTLGGVVAAILNRIAQQNGWPVPFGGSRL